MPNGKSDSQLISEMKVELHDLHYNLERNVTLRTEQLTRRIALLESCNDALCARLVAMQQEVDMLRQQLALHRKTLADEVNQPRLYLLNGQAYCRADRWSEQAA